MVENNWMMRETLNWYKHQFNTGIKTTMVTDQSRSMLGAFIRAHRERLPVPGDTTGRRRTPGWRREELAEATGVGVTWITWLEQGRDVSASAPALARLAEALRLNPAERASMFDLAGRRDPVDMAQVKDGVPQAMLDLPALLEVPCYLLDHRWTARAWNAAAQALFVGWLDTDAEDKNLLRYVFFSPQARALIGDWPGRAHRLVAEFRADFSRRPGDGSLLELVNELSEGSPDFARFWREQTVFAREGGLRSFVLPGRGPQQYEQTTLVPASSKDFKLVCLAPAASE